VGEETGLAQNSGDALGRLTGKQLVLEWVEVGYPTPADKKVQLLRSRRLCDGRNLDTPRWLNSAIFGA
jgi:hypothetical protein